MVSYIDSWDGKMDITLTLAKLIECELPVIVCVGTDRVVSDMIAPLTAEYLVAKQIPAYVYGRLANPITNRNLHSAFRYIHDSHKGKQIIVIDAGVGKMCDIGKVRVNRGGIIPAGVFGGSRVMYGDVSIMPIVSTLSIDAKTFLSCAKFNVVNNTAKSLAECISMALQISKHTLNTISNFA